MVASPTPKAETKPETKPAAPGAKSDAQKNLKSIPMEEFQKKLGSSPNGLSEAEAKKLLTQYGPNEITEKKDNLFFRFLSYSWGSIPWMIEGAVILSGGGTGWILALFSFCSFPTPCWPFGRNIGRAMRLPRCAPSWGPRPAPCEMDGKWATPKVSELVPGDVIGLRLGDILPADARLLAGDPVEVDQSALTGESLPATRKPGEAVFSRSIIKRGETDGVRDRRQHLLR